ncbi:MAG: hypothetical protein ABJP44_18005 [Sulfitobacter sp.]
MSGSSADEAVVRRGNASVPFAKSVLRLVLHLDDLDQISAGIIEYGHAN